MAYLTLVGCFAIFGQFWSNCQNITVKIQKLHSMYVVYLSIYKSGYFIVIIAFGSYTLWKFLEFSESKKAYFWIWYLTLRKPKSFVWFEIGAFESFGRKFYRKNEISLFRLNWWEMTRFKKVSTKESTVFRHKLSKPNIHFFGTKKIKATKFRKNIFQWPFNWFGMKPINFRINLYVIINLNFNNNYYLYKYKFNFLLNYSNNLHIILGKRLCLCTNDVLIHLWDSSQFSSPMNQMVWLIGMNHYFSHSLNWISSRDKIFFKLININFLKYS